MTQALDEEAKALQRDVQRLLGRCMLRLQQYEHLIKAIIAHHDLAGPIRDLEAVREERVERTSRKTLGMLVGELVGSYLVSGESGTEQDTMDDDPHDIATVSFRLRLSFSEDELARTENELRDLVQLRNDLVHHFISQHDLRSVDGCRRAQEALVADYDRIDECYLRLVEWTRDLDKAREEAVKIVQSETFRNSMIHGILPDGTVDWPASSLVSGFREAARALAAIEGEWVSVVDAGNWLVEKYPDQSPARFGCRTWQQALHEARLFDLRHLQKDGRRVICFKPKANPKFPDEPEQTWDFVVRDAELQKP